MTGLFLTWALIHQQTDTTGLCHTGIITESCRLGFINTEAKLLRNVSKSYYRRKWSFIKILVWRLSDLLYCFTVAFRRDNTMEECYKAIPCGDKLITDCLQVLSHPERWCYYMFHTCVNTLARPSRSSSTCRASSVAQGESWMDILIRGGSSPSTRIDVWPNTLLLVATSGRTGAHNKAKAVSAVTT